MFAGARQIVDDELVEGLSGPFSARSRRPAFCYQEAFARNLGWVTEWEQQALRAKRVAIAGMGGVGGVHLLTLARLGIGAFHIADPDRFELVNFNRQIGASLETIDQPKVDVLAGMARAINPELDLVVFDDGINATNLDAFLTGVDLFIDGLDFFALDIRRRVFAACAERGIPAITAAPLGMGAAYLVFLPGGMSFERYFRLAGLPPERQAVHFALGLAPAGLQRAYLVDPSRVDLAGQTGPSTAVAVQLCAGVAASEAMKLLLGRGKVRAAPYSHHFDAYRGRWSARKLRRGNANPLQRVKIAAAGRLVARLSLQAEIRRENRAPRTEVERILDCARWAPSGDNTQPWRFEIAGEDRVTVHVRPTGDVYDYADGEPTLLSAGFLLETMRIAASAHGRGMHQAYLGESDGVHRIAVNFMRQRGIVRDPLFPYVTMRSVDRRRYRLRRLNRAQKAELAAALGPGFDIEWHESFAQRWRAASINARATDIRLRIPEAFAVHRRILDWKRPFSPIGIPGAAIGLDPVARRLTRWVMQDWRRARWLNRLTGTALARLEMDLVPGIFCAAHFTVRAAARPQEGGRVAELLACGQALQRFWLTAARLGLVMQPTLAPQCFARHAREGRAFTQDARIRTKARRLAEPFARDDAGVVAASIIGGRIGTRIRTAPAARSVRRHFGDLLIEAGCEPPRFRVDV